MMGEKGGLISGAWEVSKGTNCVVRNKWDQMVIWSLNRRISIVMWRHMQRHITELILLKFKAMQYHLPPIALIQIQILSGSILEGMPAEIH